MLRELLMGRRRRDKITFEHRGKDVSRIEGFSDAVFGFALTLLVVSQQVPHTFDDLLTTLRGFFSFAVCFLVLAAIWYRHYQFFRRYGMADALTIKLNTVLLFVVLFFVYPLKFLADLFCNRLLGVAAAASAAGGAVRSALRLSQLPLVFDCYFAGFATVCLLFALLYAHAYRSRVELKLSPHEAAETCMAVVFNIIPIVVSVGGGLLLSLSRTPYYEAAAAIYLLLLGAGLPLTFRAAFRWRSRMIAASRPN